MAVARDLKGEDNNVIAVIGDGSMTGGMSFEALNNAGDLHKKMIVILNDNEMSISKNVGAMSQYLCDLRTGETYNKIKHDVEGWLKSLDFGTDVLNAPTSTTAKPPRPSSPGRSRPSPKRPTSGYAWAWTGSASMP